MKYLHFFYCCAAFFVGVCLSGCAFAQEFDLSFLQGGDRLDGQAWQLLDTKYVPGRYLVDLSLNEKSLGKRIIDVAPEDTEQLCVSKAWLSDAQININTLFYQSSFDSKRRCYRLEKEPHTRIEFDFTTQSLVFVIPQAGLDKTQKKRRDWDYGVNALRFNYTVNGNENNAGTDVYASSGIVANIGSWLVNSSMNATQDHSEIRIASATRALQSLESDFSVGKIYGGSAFAGGASMFGVGLRSNSAMSSHSNGFAPVFSGFAKTYARVTLIQGGSTLYSEMVPPGPFDISNVTLLNSGDVTLVVTESDGSKTEQLFPVNIVSGMLSPSEREFDVNVGTREGGDVGGGFFSGSFGYGFNDYTLRSGLVTHARYTSSGLEITRGLGGWGTMSLQGAYSRGKYDDGLSLSGRKLALTYAKKFGKSTDLQVTAQNASNYVDFSAFNPSRVEPKRQKNQYNVNLSHRVTERVWGNVSGWQRTYWDGAPTQSGLNVSVSSYFDLFSISFSGLYSQSRGRDNYGVSASVSVPFTLFGKKSNAYTLMNSDLNGGGGGGGGAMVGMSSSLTEKINYSISAGQDFAGAAQSRSLQTSYEGDRLLANVAVSQGNGYSSRSASISGSVLALPEQRDLIFTRNATGTVAIANVKDTPGVKFEQSPYPTNSKGDAVVPVSSYNVNHITLDGSTLPLDMELLTTDEDVIPTGGAVVFVPFDAVKVKHYLLQIKDKQGAFIENGSWAVTGSGMPLGFITQHGVLFLNSIDKPTEIKIGQCIISGKSLKDTSALQEVICES